MELFGFGTIVKYLFTHLFRRSDENRCPELSARAWSQILLLKNKHEVVKDRFRHWCAHLSFLIQYYNKALLFRCLYLTLVGYSFKHSAPTLPIYLYRLLSLF